MLTYKKIKVGRKTIEAIALPLASKTLIVLRGSKGYIMCGYLNLIAAQKLNDVAVKIVGVSNIKEAVNARVYALSAQAKKRGIYKGQAIKDVLKIIA